MEGSSNKAAYIGTAVKTAARGSYETGKSGAWKTWHAEPQVSSKGVVNKDRKYTIKYAPEVECNKTSEI